MMDRREAFRGRVYYGGRLAFNDRKSTLDCIVRNFSQAGARCRDQRSGHPTRRTRHHDRTAQRCLSGAGRLAPGARSRACFSKPEALERHDIAGLGAPGPRQRTRQQGTACVSRAASHRILNLSFYSRVSQHEAGAAGAPDPVAEIVGRRACIGTDPHLIESSCAAAAP
jgi:hypothetical protein